MHFESVTTQQNKMAALGVMASGIAHEINNPLSIISINAEIIKDELGSSNPDIANIKDRLNKIEQTNDRIAGIVKSLRTLSRTNESDPKQHVQVMTVLNDTISLCKEKLQIGGIRLTIFCDADLTLWCRPAEISQVVLNLLINAHDAVKGSDWRGHRFGS